MSILVYSPIEPQKFEDELRTVSLNKIVTISYSEEVL